MQEGEIVKHGESATLYCNAGFSPANSDSVCNDGEWSKQMQCYTSKQNTLMSILNSGVLTVFYINIKVYVYLFSVVYSQLDDWYSKAVLPIGT